jgi:hypothetical protein
MARISLKPNHQPSVRKFTTVRKYLDPKENNPTHTIQLGRAKIVITRNAETAQLEAEARIVQCKLEITLAEVDSAIATLQEVRKELSRPVVSK